MTAGRVVVAVVLAAVRARRVWRLRDRTPDLGKLPLAPGSRIVTRVRQCDAGSNAYCAVELVVVDPAWHDSGVAGVRREADPRAPGWTADRGANGDEDAAESPGDKLRVTYATAYGDLKDIELGWIKRSHAISVALSHALFDRSAAMSVMLEIGS